MLEGVLIDQAIEVLFEFTSHCGWAARARAIHQALRPLLGKALHPFAEGRMRQVKGRGDGPDVVASDDLPDGLRTAKEAGLLGLREHGISGRQCISAKMAFEWAHCFAPGGWPRGISYVRDRDALLIGAKWLRLKFPRFCL